MTLAPGLLLASDVSPEPLRLGLTASTPVGPALAATGNELHARSLRAPPRRSRQVPRFEQAEPSLGQRALESVLATPEPQAGEASPRDATARFAFERQGHALRDLQRGYRNMCDNLSGKVWDDPNGRRIKFDIAGKPGVAVEIPIR